MSNQTAIFLQVYILPEKVDALQELLNSGGNPLANSSFFPIEKLGTVHFARWIIAPATDKFRASLIYSANIDGTQNDHLESLADELSESIDKIMEYCEGYPVAENRTASSRYSYLAQHAKRTPAFYVGAPQRTVKQIKQEAELQREIENYVTANRGKWKSSKEAYDSIKSHIASDSKWDWVKTLGKPPKRKGLIMILFILCLIPVLPFLALAILIIGLFYEPREKPFGKAANQIPIERMEFLKEHEDIIFQNQLSQVFETKGGLRKLMLKFMLWATNFAAKHWFVDGELMGTPTIHFARWVFIDGGKRFVFFSNFDGSFNGYLGDFVDNNGWGLNSIYGAAKGYPRTKFMFGHGSYNIQQFIGWGRVTQVRSPIWYSAYPWYGLPQIITRSKMRSALNTKNEPSKEDIETLLKSV